MNELAVSRRRVVGSALAMAAAGFERSLAAAGPGPAELRPRTRGQDAAPLSLAMLDRHWKAIEPLADDYASGAGIELKVSALTYDELYTQLSLALTQRAGTFDVISLSDAWIPQFATFLTPLDIPSDQAAAFVPVSFDLGRYPADSLPCALPWLGETQFFVSRPEWLQRASHVPPVTWDDTVECATTVAEQLEPDSDLAAFGIRSLDGHQLVDSFLPVLRGFGKNLIDMESSIPQLDTAEALAAMQVFLNLAALSSDESAAVGAPDNAERFAAGQISMMSNFWSSDLLAARTGTAASEAGPLASTLQPAQPRVEHRSMSGVWLAGIPVGSPAPDVARTFLGWLTGRACQAQLPALNLPPVLTDVLEDDSLSERFPDLPVLLQMLETSTPRSRSPFYPQLEQLVATELQRAVAGDETGDVAMKNANVALREFLVREGVLTA